MNIKKFFSKNKLRRAGLHIIFWLVVIIYSTYLYGYPNYIVHTLKLIILGLPVDMLHVYSVLYFLIPKFLLKQKYFLFGSLFVVFGVAEEIVARFLFYYIYFPESFRGMPFWDLKDMSYYFGYFYIAFAATVIKLIKIWLQKNKEAHRITEEKYQAEIKLKEAELKLLKAQVHPHFLFNTLNNLYGLTLESSKKAPEVVLKLSELLDYMLYKCNTQTVKLIDEVKCLKTYIDLERLRYNEDDLRIKIEEKGQFEGIQIAPLLLLPFVENAFKHGVSDSGEFSWIDIYIGIEDNYFIFQIENAKSESSDSEKGYKQGIGLKNVRNRLEISYQNNYKIEIEDNKNSFYVNLSIELKQDVS